MGPLLRDGTDGRRYGLIAVSPWFAVALIVSGVTGIADALGSVAGTTLIQRSSGDSIRGRIFAVIGVIYPAGNIIAFSIGGPLLAAHGPRGVFAAGGVIGLAATAAMWPVAMRLRRLANAPVDGPELADG